MDQVVLRIRNDVVSCTHVGRGCDSDLREHWIEGVMSVCVEKIATQ